MRREIIGFLVFCGCFVLLTNLSIGRTVESNALRVELSPVPPENASLPMMLACSLSQSSTVVDASCYSVCDGVAQVVASNGDGPYTYVWASGQTTSTITGLCAASYCVTVTDSLGCQADTCVTIAEPQALVLTISANNVMCYGSCDASATVSLSGGTPPYTYQWNDPVLQSTVVATNLCSGTYTVTVTDTNGCNQSTSVAITQPQQLALNVSTTSSTCGFSNGSACVSVIGGSAPYIIQWDDPSTTVGACVSSVFAGIYNPIVSDANGCSLTMPVVVNDIVGPTIDSITWTDVVCYGDSNGTATTSASGVSPPFSYYWQSGSDTIGVNMTTMFGLWGGSYTITVVDANGCISGSSVFVSEPSGLASAILSSTGASCSGVCDGSAMVMVGGGVTPYSYLWTDGCTTTSCDSLCAGIHNVIVTDNNGCATTKNVAITEPAALVITPTQTDVTCNAACDGTATASVSNGTAPYTYLWDDSYFQTTLTADSLCSGIYSVAVTDNSGCSQSANVMITEPQTLSLVATVVDATCGLPNGSACVNVIGGVAPYIIQWNDPGLTIGVCLVNVYAGVYNPIVMDANGCFYTIPVIINDLAGPIIDSVTTMDPTCFGDSTGTASVISSGGSGSLTYVWKNNGGDTIGGNATSVIGLWGDTFTIAVIDTNYCISSMVFTIYEPTSVASAVISSSGPSCFGVCDGSATVIAGNGVSPYSYLWTNGQTTSAATGLCAGTDSVLVSDANSCTTFSIVTITEPQMLFVTDSVSEVSCNGDSDGAIYLNVTGGTPFFSYSWIPSVGSGPVVTNLPTGTYTVTIQDINGCVLNQSISVPEPLPLATVTALAPSYCGGTNGQATVTGLGGTIPYTYLWPDGQTSATVTNLVAGVTYNFELSDANGCMLIEPIAVSDEPGPTISASSVGVDCYGDDNGQATATVDTLGTPPFTYVWDDPLNQNTATATNLPGDITYNVTVTDANGCTASLPIYITENPQLALIIVGDQSICSGDSVELSVSGSGGVLITDYLYTWDNGITTQAQWVSPSVTTSYSVYIEDDVGCVSPDTGMVVVSVLGPLNVSLIYEDTICSDDSTTLTAEATSGVGYTYLWNTGATSSSVTVAPAGTMVYSVTVTGNCGTSASDSAIIVPETCVSILENDKGSKSLSVYPNPTTGILIIECEFSQGDQALIEIFHYTGALVYSNACDIMANKISHSVNLDHQAEGIYFVRVQSDDDMWTGKIVLE